MSHKAPIWFLAIAAGLLLATGAQGAKPRNANPGAPAANVAQSDNPAVAGNNEFALKLYQQLRSEKGNLFYSPFSLESALAMTAQGARGNTATEMYAALALKNDGSAHEAMGNLNQHFNGGGADRGYQLSVANALWGQKGVHWQPEFLANSQKFYGAGIRDLDFAKAQQASNTINQWVERETHDKIKDLISPDAVGPLTRMVLTNAIYFKGNWASQFKAERTKEEPFLLSGGEKTKAPLMHQTSRFGYTANASLQALELPYVKNELALVVLLPRKADGVAELEQSLSLETLQSTLGRLQQETVDVTIPKFKLTCQFSLPAQLQKLGMVDAFGNKADFTGMASGEDLFISDVIHKAFVDVNEEGTEAAAATGVVVATKSRVETPRIPEFRADHPFLFLIRDQKTGTLLFLGRVENPAAGG